MKKRRPNILRIALILLIIAVCIVTGILFFNPSVRFITGNHVLEKGESYKAEDFILKSNGEVTPEAEYLDTEEVGRHHFRYKVKKGLFEKEAVFFYEVLDTTPPVIEIINETVFKDYEEPYTEEEMSENIIINEGILAFETDYDADLAGTYTVKVKAIDDYGNESEASYKAVVKDNEAPYVFKTGNGAKILRGSSFNISDIVSYGDNADPKPALTYEGEVNTSSLGRYPLHARLTDASGNKTEWDLTVEVVSKLPEDEPDDYYYPYEEFLKDYKGAGRSYGIDVSSWQGDIDFDAVKEAGCEFVIMRIGYSHKGEFTIDKKFEQNMQRAKEARLPVGIYLFCYDNSEEYLLKSMDQMFSVLGDTELELPVIFDWENFSNYHDYELSFQELNHLYDVFKEEVERRGYESMLYGSKHYLQTVWSHKDTRRVWLAHYVSESNYEDPYEVWQVSDSGRIEGIDGNVDLDIIFMQQ